MQRMTVLAALSFLALAGCQSPAPVAVPAPPPVAPPEPRPAAPVPVAPAPAPVPVPTQGERALADGVALYDAGDFNGTIRLLWGSKEIWSEPTAPRATSIKLAAHKYIAFSYCVTSRPTQCRQHFVDALKLDSTFDLEPAEKTHPVWGKEFERAKKQMSAPPPPTRRPATTAPPLSTPPKAP